MIIKAIVTIIMLSFLYLNAYSKHLGKYGLTFLIEESDFLSVIESKLKHLEETGEIEKINKEYQNKIKELVKRPTPIKGIEKVTLNSIRKFDPTVFLEEDIVTKDSDMKSNLIYKEGTPINPLEYQPFSVSLLFIDGDDESQLEYARSLQDQNLSLMIILINGEPGLKKIGGKEYYYFFDQFGVYSKKFGITQVPSLVYQERKEKLLTIKEVKLDDKT